jgi:hypothetical protein
MKMADEPKPEKAKSDEEVARKHLETLFDQDPDLKESLHRIGSHLYFADDIVLVVLKGHLLVEESLTSIIRKYVPHGEFIDEAGLRFYQKVQIARSLSLDEHQNEMWSLVLGLNRVRNDLAHALEHPKVEDHIRDLRNKYFEAFPNISAIQANRQEPDNMVLKDLVAAILGFLGQFKKEVDRYRWWLNIVDKFVNPHRHNKAKKADIGQAEPADVES